ncbi:MAG TPA: isoprenylcysteine carboxylmethyltransferase family protein [Candidatus Limnocylindrales bacterium]
MDESRVPRFGARGEGWTLAQVVLMFSIVVVAWRASPAPPATIVELALRILGLVGVLAGLALILVSSHVLRLAGSFSTLPRPLESGRLVEAGPYGLIRHPIYAGLVLAGTGVALYRVSIAVAVLTVALAIVLDLKRRREEAWLVNRFPGYGEYRNRTKALVPFVY